MGWRRGAGGGLERDGPLILDEGYGVYVKDLEGNEYIEGMAGLWCAALGFSNERLIQAAVTQMRKLPTYHTDPVVRDHRAYVVEAGADIIGVLVLMDKEDGIILDNVAILPSRQGEGLGRRLVEHAESEARRLGHRHLDL